ncbi:hypothetical protein PG997_007277 [Apiospora hydei]|uniref:Uncharacterized protein n=1 Tax=Apiospora hydei TaxID=1337664 RepID=A0ABR1WB99_9PEZI
MRFAVQHRPGLSRPCRPVPPTAAISAPFPSTLSSWRGAKKRGTNPSYSEYQSGHHVRIPRVRRLSQATSQTPSSYGMVLKRSTSAHRELMSNPFSKSLTCLMMNAFWPSSSCGRTSTDKACGESIVFRTKVTSTGTLSSFLLPAPAPPRGIPPNPTISHLVVTHLNQPAPL